MRLPNSKRTLESHLLINVACPIHLIMYILYFSLKYQLSCSYIYKQCHCCETITGSTYIFEDPCYKLTLLALTITETAYICVVTSLLLANNYLGMRDIGKCKYTSALGQPLWCDGQRAWGRNTASPTQAPWTWCSRRHRLVRELQMPSDWCWWRTRTYQLLRRVSCSSSSRWGGDGEWQWNGRC
jgi:hypothetical protein